MIKNKFKFISVLIIIAVSFIIASGCQPAEKPNPPADPNNGVDNYNNDMQNNTDNYGMNNDMNDDMNGGMNDGMNNEDMGMDMNNDMANRAESIADNVVDISGVNDASVVLRDNTALVGVVLQGDRTMTADMREKIVNDVKRVDKDIEVVKVSDSPDMFEEIDNIAQEINRGSAITDFEDDIRDLQNRMDANMK